MNSPARPVSAILTLSRLKPAQRLPNGLRSRKSSSSTIKICAGIEYKSSRSCPPISLPVVTCCHSTTAASTGPNSTSLAVTRMLPVQEKPLRKVTRSACTFTSPSTRPLSETSSASAVRSPVLPEK